MRYLALALSLMVGFVGCSGYRMKRYPLVFYQDGHEIRRNTHFERRWVHEEQKCLKCLLAKPDQGGQGDAESLGKPTRNFNQALAPPVEATGKS